MDPEDRSCAPSPSGLGSGLASGSASVAAEFRSRAGAAGGPAAHAAPAPGGDFARGFRGVARRRGLRRVSGPFSDPLSGPLSDPFSGPFSATRAGAIGAMAPAPPRRAAE